MATTKVGVRKALKKGLSSLKGKTPSQRYGKKNSVIGGLMKSKAKATKKEVPTKSFPVSATPTENDNLTFPKASPSVAVSKNEGPKPKARVIPGVVLDFTKPQNPPAGM